MYVVGSWGAYYNTFLSNFKSTILEEEAIVYFHFRSRRRGKGPSKAIFLYFELVLFVMYAMYLEGGSLA